MRILNFSFVEMTTETSAGSSVVSLPGNGRSYMEREDEYRRKIINTQGETTSNFFRANNFSHFRISFLVLAGRFSKLLHKYRPHILSGFTVPPPSHGGRHSSYMFHKPFRRRDLIFTLIRLGIINFFNRPKTPYENFTVH